MLRGRPATLDVGSSLSKLHCVGNTIAAATLQVCLLLRKFVDISYLCKPGAVVQRSQAPCPAAFLCSAEGS